MPCRSDYMEPNAREVESVRVINFLNEVGVLKNKPSYYGDVDKLDRHTELLCEWCQNNDVKEYSLELQIWWRDHQAADKRRLEAELDAKKKKKDRDAAKAKLTEYERELLGIK